MIQTDIQEGNRLIADFADLLPIESELWGDCYRHQTGAIILINELQYHSSWDWLMPVVEKIEGMPSDKVHGKFGVYISSNCCAIQGTNFRSERWQKPPVYFRDHYAETKIEATWQAVTSFIQWYNEQKQTPQ